MSVFPDWPVHVSEAVPPGEVVMRVGPQSDEALIKFMGDGWTSFCTWDTQPSLTIRLTCLTNGGPIVVVAVEMFCSQNW